MGTRSITRIQDEHGSYATIYMQYDGYPEGLGAELADFLAPFTVVNGFGIGAEMGSTANGAGCLAAQLVAHFKTGVGNVYLAPKGSADIGEEYFYDILYKDGELRISVFEVPYEGNNELMFKGSPTEMQEWIKALGSH